MTTRPWRVAQCLLELRDQINARWPLRAKGADGTIGDAAHQTRDSDHNPWYTLPGQPNMGIVTALDITNDPAHGVDIDKLSDALVSTRDPRIKYVIANGLILDSRPDQHPWTWQRYSGTDPHTGHLHISCTPTLCDQLGGWPIELGVPLPHPTVAGSGGERNGYPTLCRGTGGAGDTTGSWWVSEFHMLLAAHSPGYYGEIMASAAGRAEVTGCEVGDVTLNTVHQLALQVLGDKLAWRGAITQQIWAIFPPVPGH